MGGGVAGRAWASPTRGTAVRLLEGTALHPGSGLRPVAAASGVSVTRCEQRLEIRQARWSAY